MKTLVQQILEGNSEDQLTIFLDPKIRKQSQWQSQLQ